MSGTAFRGVSSASDNRFANKEKKLKKNMKFPKEYDVKIDLSKGINWEVMKTWITPRVTELLGTDDEVLVNYVCEQFENKKTVDPRQVQIDLTGFLEKNTSLFVKELWVLLASAAENDSGIPTVLLEQKAAEVEAQKKRKALIDGKIQESIQKDRRDQEEHQRREASRRHDAQRERERRQRSDMAREDRERHERRRAAERAESDRRRDAERRADRERDDRRQIEKERSRRHRDRSEERLLQPGVKRSSSSPPPAGENGVKRSRKEAEERVADLPESSKIKKVKKDKKAKKVKKEKKEKKTKREKRGPSEESGSGSEHSQGNKRSLEDELRQKALLSVKKE